MSIHFDEGSDAANWDGEGDGYVEYETSEGDTVLFYVSVGFTRKTDASVKCYGSYWYVYDGDRISGASSADGEGWFRDRLGYGQLLAETHEIHWYVIKEPEEPLG